MKAIRLEAFGDADLLDDPEAPTTPPGFDPVEHRYAEQHDRMHDGGFCDHLKPHPALPMGDPTPEDAIIQAAAVDWVALLTPAESRVLEARVRIGGTNREVADELGVSERYVGQCLQRAAAKAASVIDPG